MMRQVFPRRWLIAPTIFLAFCSRSAPPALTGPSQLSMPSAVIDGTAGATALGDVKVGVGRLEFVRLRLTGGHAGGLYVNPGGGYGMDKGAIIELWAEWDPAAAPRNPRFIVNWGEGEVDFTGCGSCKLIHKYNTEALFTVTASLDDMSGTMVTRKFSLDSRPPEPEPEPTPTPTPTPTPIPTPIPTPTPGWIASHTGGGQTVYKFSSRPLPASPANLASWYQQVCENAGLRPVSCDPAIYGPSYNASAWNAVILGNAYWGCNVSSGILSKTGWANIITLHTPLFDDRGLCEEGCSISGNDVFPICTDAP